MTNDHLKPFFENANVIQLDESRLLNHESYGRVRAEFDDFLRAEVEFDDSMMQSEVEGHGEGEGE